MAAVASIMEVSLDDLPDLFDTCCEWDGESGEWKEGDEHWWNVLRGGVKAHGWEAVYVGEYASDNYPMGYAIGGGDSPRPSTVTEDGKNAGHVCVFLDGELVWDPHPSGAGLASGPDDWIILLPPLGRAA